MSTLADEQTQHELETVEKESYLTMGEDLVWLKNSPQFQRLIMEGYLKEKALASVSMLAHPSVIQNGQRPAVMEDLVAASNLSYFFMMVENQYEGALNAELEPEEFEDEGYESKGGE